MYTLYLDFTNCHTTVFFLVQNPIRTTVHLLVMSLYSHWIWNSLPILSFMILTILKRKSSFFVTCPSTWVCLSLSQDWVPVMHFHKENHGKGVTLSQSTTWGDKQCWLVSVTVMFTLILSSSGVSRFLYCRATIFLSVTNQYLVEKDFETM